MRSRTQQDGQKIVPIRTSDHEDPALRFLVPSRAAWDGGAAREQRESDRRLDRQIASRALIDRSCHESTRCRRSLLSFFTRGCTSVVGPTRVIEAAASPDWL